MLIKGKCYDNQWKITLHSTLCEGCELCVFTFNHKIMFDSFLQEITGIINKYKTNIHIF